jgi:hypothetical protein
MLVAAPGFHGTRVTPCASAEGTASTWNKQDRSRGAFFGSLVPGHGTRADDRGEFAVSTSLTLGARRP